jgi:hypothetical protein
MYVFIYMHACAYMCACVRMSDNRIKFVYSIVTQRTHKKKILLWSNKILFLSKQWIFCLTRPYLHFACEQNRHFYAVVGRKSTTLCYRESHNYWPRSAKAIYSSARVNDCGNLSIFRYGLFKSTITFSHVHSCIQICNNIVLNRPWLAIWSTCHQAVASPAIK